MKNCPATHGGVGVHGFAKVKKILLTTVLKRMKNCPATHGGGGVHGFEKVKKKFFSQLFKKG